VEVEECGADRAHRDPGAYPLQDPGNEQPGDIPCLGEQEHAQHLDREGEEQRRAAADMV